MTDKDRIKELEEKIRIYEGLPTAAFYQSVLEGLEHITREIKNKTLDLDSDPFAKSVFVIAKESDKVMNALSKGVAAFTQEPSDEKKAKKKESHQGTGI